MVVLLVDQKVERWVDHLADLLAGLIDSNHKRKDLNRKRSCLRTERQSIVEEEPKQERTGQDMDRIHDTEGDTRTGTE